MSIQPATSPPASASDHRSVAIVVAARNEAGRIVGAVDRLRRDFPGTEIVVVDGDSDDGTAELAAGRCRMIRSRPGRARQMNAGAAATGADVLWFVHADVTVDPQAAGQIHAALADERVVGGGLTLRFDARSLGLDYLAWSSTKRARHLHQVFGDQALFVRRRAFDALGGFPDLPVMEDLEFSRRLARLGRLAVLDATVTASARRFTEHGTWSMIAYMQYLKVLYFAGVDPGAIAKRYRIGPPWTRRRHPAGVKRSMSQLRWASPPRSSARSTPPGAAAEGDVPR